jgi:hypothetical protein
MQDSPAPDLFKCKLCGLESPLKDAFIQHKGWFSKRTTTVCFQCEVKRQWRSMVRAILLMLAAGVLLYLIMPYGFFGKALLQALGTMLLVLVPLIIAHELAHALAARLVGLSVFQVHIGAGRVLWSARFLKTRWFLHLLPVSGATVAAGPDLPGYRWRQFLVLLAGPALHAVLSLCSWWLLSTWSFERFGSPLHSLVLLLFWMNILLLVSNLIPRKVALSSGVAGTDGGAILKLLYRPDELLRQYHRAYYVHQVVDAVDREDLAAARRWSDEGAQRYPEDALMINTSGYALIAAGDYAAGRAAFRRVLQFENLEEVVRAMGENNVAYANFMLADEALRAEADEYSAEAYGKIAWEPAVVGTRGAVLLWLGRIDEGIELLKQAMLKTSERRNKAADAAFIALGEYQRGNPGEAQKYLDLARKLDPNSPALARVLPEIGARDSHLSPLQRWERE